LKLQFRLKDHICINNTSLVNPLFFPIRLSKMLLNPVLIWSVITVESGNMYTVRELWFTVTQRQEMHNILSPFAGVWGLVLNHVFVRACERARVKVNTP